MMCRFSLQAISAALLSTCLILAGHASATFSVSNTDSAGEGFNDTSAFTATGGNNATTLGQARLNVLNEAGRIWGLRINSSVTIVMEASFDALTCTSTSGTLASAGPTTFFTRSNQPMVLLPVALANAITSTDNSTTKSDISVSINSNVGTGSSCLSGKSFYLGFDHNNGTNIDLLNVLLHEIGHGLGFLSFSESVRSANNITDKFTGYEQFIYSESLGKFWPAMTSAERSSASVASGTITFNSTSVNSNISTLTTSTGLSATGNHLRLYAPSTFSDGSSVSHWDTVAFPNLLMEPFITANPTGSTDLTGCVLRDIGWTNALCPDGAAPTAASQTVTLSEDTPTAIVLQGTATDSSRTLSYSIASQPAHGSLTSISGASVTYTPASNYNGADSFLFQVSDGINTSAAATVTISVAAVNDAPVATTQSVSTTPGTAVSITLSGSDAEGSALSYSVVTNPGNGTLSGSAPTLTYTPNSGFTGTDSFTFRVNDGQLSSSTASVSIQVNAPPASNSGGGGWWSLPLLALLSMLRLVQRRHRATVMES